MIRKTALAILLLLPAAARAQFCPSCIQNSAAPQNAQINIGTATIRGTLTVSTVTATFFNTTNLTASAFFGDGSGITNMNATQLLSGTVPSGRLSGSYTGVTGVGTVTAGTWHGTPIGTQYGGTGQNFVNISSGSIVYFNVVGGMSTLLAGTPTGLLQTNGTGFAPSWTTAPNVSGKNIYGLPLLSLSSGTLPSNIKVSTSSIPFILGSQVVGDIAGNAANINGNLSLSQLQAGTLSNSVVASSITATGVTPNTYGGTATYVQLGIHSDGRVYTAAQGSIALPPSQLTSGTLPSGVAVPPTNISAGTFPSGVFIPANGVSTGTLNVGVVAQTIAASGVVAATYGDSTHVPRCTFGSDGRATSCANVAISAGGSSPGGSNTNIQFNNSGAFGGSPNLAWDNTNHILKVLNFIDIGGTPSTSPNLYIQSTQGPPTNYVLNVSSGDAMTVLFGVTEAGNALVNGTMTATTFSGALATSNLTGLIGVNQGGTGHDFSATAQGNIPYFHATGTFAALPPGTSGQCLKTNGASADPFWGSCGSGNPAGSNQDVQFNNGGTFGADTGKFEWDSTNHFLGISTGTPTAPLEVHGFGSTYTLIVSTSITPTSYNFFVSTLGAVGMNSVSYNWPSSQGAANTYLKDDGSGNLSWTNPVAGSNTQLQFNSSNVLGASANLTWSPNTLTINGIVSASTTTFNGVTYDWPGSQGAANSLLQNNGSGVVSWSTAPVVSGAGISSLNAANISVGTLAVARGGTGTGTAFTTGSVVFAGASGVYSQDNSNFFWDSTNHRLGIGNAAPTVGIDATHQTIAVATTTLNGVTYNWPAAQGAASKFLQNDGSGNLSWATAGGGSTGYWVLDSSGTVSNGTTLTVPLNTGTYKHWHATLIGAPTTSSNVQDLEFIVNGDTSSGDYITTMMITSSGGSSIFSNTGTQKFALSTAGRAIANNTANTFFFYNIDVTNNDSQTYVEITGGFRAIDGSANTAAIYSASGMLTTSTSSSIGIVADQNVTATISVAGNGDQ